MQRVCINGLGRIGKAIFRIAKDNPQIQVVAINEIRPNKQNIAYTINYDSTYGSLEEKYEVDGDYLVNGSHKVFISHEKNIQNIDFKSLGIDVIIDASGIKTEKEILDNLPIKAIFLTHPNKTADINMILGVNESSYNKEKIISTSSCNATALLPVLKTLDENYGIEYGDIATIHPLLNHQKTLDSGCIGSTDRDITCNFEFGRGSLQNIIPSNTTTIDACSLVLPSINSELISSNSFRVPTETVGAINISISLKTKTDKDEIIKLFQKLQKKQHYRVFYNSFDPLVSSDFKSLPYTSIIDHRFTQVIRNKMVKLVLWYDNEWGYASKVVDMISLLKKS